MKGYRALAAAIRKGAKMRPQGRGRLFQHGRSCALGAAYEGATGVQCGPFEYSAVKKAFPVLKGTDGRLTPVCSEIYTRNDLLRQTREQIADWLDSLEPRESDRQFTDRVLREIVNGVETSVGQEREATTAK